MSLVTISGFPCSGKSTRAAEIKTLLERRLPGLPVLVISDETQNITKLAYDDATSEKAARATLFSAVERHLSPDRIVILDAMNYIKGYRYQLYCAAREVRCRVCTIQVAAPPDKCIEWNDARPEERRYTRASLENLISRFEEPSPFVRWDSPLITIPWTDSALPEDAIFDAVTKSELKPPTAATQSAPTTSTDYLTLVDSAATSVLQAVLATQSAVPGGGSTSLAIPLAGPTSSLGAGKQQSTQVALTLPARTVTMPLLQRHKRQFVTLQRQAGREISETGLVELFAKYLDDVLN